MKNNRTNRKLQKIRNKNKLRKGSPLAFDICLSEMAVDEEWELLKQEIKDWMANNRQRALQSWNMNFVLASYRLNFYPGLDMWRLILFYKIK